MKLYYNPKSRAVIAKWMLDECDAKYEIVPIEFEKGEHKTPEFLKINPAGKLPALIDGESKIFETAAICLYLGDKFAEANLAPRSARQSAVDTCRSWFTRRRSSNPPWAT
jgi:glutathione S-transferase